MKGLGFFGDLHLSDRTPSFRNDNYPRTILSKAGQILRVISALDGKPVGAGDLFTLKKNLDYSVLSAFASLLLRYGKIDSILGNHDFVVGDPDIGSYPFGVLVSAGLVEVLKEKVYTINGKRVFVVGFSFDLESESDSIIDKITSYPLPGTYDYYIAVVHAMILPFAVRFKFFPTKRFLKMPFDAMVVGHSHYGPDLVEESGKLFVYPGAVVRGMGSVDKGDRPVGFYFFNGEFFLFQEIKVEPYSAVVRDRALSQKQVYNTTPVSITNLPSVSDFNAGDFWPWFDETFKDKSTEVMTVVRRYLGAAK